MSMMVCILGRGDSLSRGVGGGKVQTKFEEG